MPDAHYFPDDYFAARAAFQSRAQGGEQLHHVLHATGPGGEALSIDGACIGAAAPRRLVLITSGIHGVEGVAGSAVQQLWLSEFAHAIPADTAFLLVHALNPWGYAHGRRVNEHNVDLNRNALAEFPGPENAAYRALDAWLNPASPVPRLDDFAWQAVPMLWRHGRAALTQAVAAGQYAFPRGLFYGGTAREESLRVLSGWLQQPRYAGVQQLWHIDLHTGLGGYAGHQLLVSEPAGSPAFAAWARGFGAQVVKSDHPSQGSHYSAHGILATLTREVFTAAPVSAATLEFGTRGPVAMLRLLRAENRLHHHGACSAGKVARVRAALRDATAPRDPAWRAAVIAGGRTILTRLQALLAPPAG